MDKFNEYLIYAGLLGGACYLAKVVVAGLIQGKDKAVKIAKDVPAAMRENQIRRKGKAILKEQEELATQQQTADATADAPS